MDLPRDQKPIEILLVEDNPGDARLTEELLRDGDIPTKINHVRDGVQALAFLRRDGAFREAPRPELILLDLNLPRIDGRELLNQIKRDPKLKAIPVVVLTGSPVDSYNARMLDVQADCFIAKPIDAAKFVTIVRAIGAQTSEAKDSAGTASNAKVKLLADLNHELRTRLNPIIAFSEMMELELKGSLNSDYREYAHNIHESANQLLQMVFDILDLSKIEMRRLTLNEGKFAVGLAIESCLDSVRDQAAAAGIKLTRNLAPNLPQLSGDHHLVKEMVMTLLSAAIANGRPGNSLDVSAIVSNVGGLSISVRDTGLGIVAADGAKPTDPEDPGVGLSLCRSICELHGGRLDVVSRPGAGATVTAHFPASRCEAAGQRAATDGKPSWAPAPRLIGATAIRHGR